MLGFVSITRWEMVTVTRGPLRSGVLVSLLAVSICGGLLAAPSIAHDTTSIRHNWTRHYKLLAKKIFYTKRQANTRFINLGERASNANLVDGLDSTSFASSSHAHSGRHHIRDCRRGEDRRAAGARLRSLRDRHGRGRCGERPRCRSPRRDGLRRIRGRGPDGWGPVVQGGGRHPRDHRDVRARGVHGSRGRVHRAGRDAHRERHELRNDRHLPSRCVRCEQADRGFESTQTIGSGGTGSWSAFGTVSLGPCRTRHSPHDRN